MGLWMVKQGEKISNIRRNVVPVLRNGKQRKTSASLGSSSKNSGLDFHVETSVGAEAPTYVALTGTFQQLYNQHKQGTLDPVANLLTQIGARVKRPCCER